MPKTSLFVPVAKGLNQGVDPRVSPADVPLRLENVQFDRRGAVVRRPGFAALPKTVNPSPVFELDAARAIFSTGAELCILGSTRLFAFDPSTDKWIDRGPVPPACGRAETIFRDERWYQSADAASGGGYTMFLGARVYGGTSGAPLSTTWDVVSVVRADDARTISVSPYAGFDETDVSADRPHSPRVAHAGAHLYGFYLKGTTGASLEVVSWDTTTGLAQAPAHWGSLLPAGTIWVALTSGETVGATSSHANIRTYDAIGDALGGICLAYLESIRASGSSAAIARSRLVRRSSSRTPWKASTSPPSASRSTTTPTPTFST